MRGLARTVLYYDRAGRKYWQRRHGKDAGPEDERVLALVGGGVEPFQGQGLGTQEVQGDSLTQLAKGSTRELEPGSACEEGQGGRGKGSSHEGCRDGEYGSRSGQAGP